MKSQLYYEDVSVGQEVPAIEKSVTTVNITMYLATVWLMDRIHFDYPFATQRRGLPNVVAPGNMAGDYYAQLLDGWAGEKGRLRRISIQFRNFMAPGDTLTCSGRVTGKNIRDGKGLVELELRIKNREGVNCVPGTGLVELPLRAAA